MKIGVLTSSRADYGIYLPLLKKLRDDVSFELEIIAFGTHLSQGHGYTITEIEKENFSKVHQISSLISNDDEISISTTYGLTVLKFADFWNNNKFQLVFCLGDRYEMSAAVQAGIPFGVRFAHLHGGETTLGAIDNIYRHQITLASNIHFTATKEFKNKVSNLIGTNKNVYQVGALSIDNIGNFKPINKKIFYTKFEILDEDFVLVTFHPETISSIDNIKHAKTIRKSLSLLSKKLFIVITMPNADTLGSIFRNEIIHLKNEYPTRVLLVENFGKDNYFSAMHYCKLMIGNTSSGIIEAASFGKFVVNVGNRQKGRLQSDNIIDVDFDENSIVKSVNKALKKGKYNGGNVYFSQGASKKILEIIKKHI